MQFEDCRHSGVGGYGVVVYDVYVDAPWMIHNHSHVCVYWICFCRGERRLRSRDRNVWVFYVFDAGLMAMWFDWWMDWWMDW